MLKAIHAQESREAAEKKAKTIVENLRSSKMSKAAVSSNSMSTKPWPTTLSRTSIGRKSALIIRWNGSCERSGAGRASLTHFQTASLVSTWLQRDCATSLERPWSTKRYMNMRPLLPAADYGNWSRCMITNGRKNLDTTKTTSAAAFPSHNKII
jgi:putative transposase